MFNRLYPDYYEAIKNPMDLTKIKANFQMYPTVDEVISDIRLVWDNCRFFNKPGSNLYAAADKLSKEFEDFLEVLKFKISLKL